VENIAKKGRQNGTSAMVVDAWLASFRAPSPSGPANLGNRLIRYGDKPTWFTSKTAKGKSHENSVL
jgi:hypothetical protein